MKTLGIDLSTITAGYCLSENKNIITCGFFDLTKGKNYKEKASIIISGLDGKDFDLIIVEEALLGFAFGKSNSKSIISLVKNKAVICYILEEYFKKTIYYANATTMRKQLFGISRIKGIPPKTFVKTQIEKMFDISPWIKLNRNGDPDKRMEDVYDAIVASCYNFSNKI